MKVEKRETINENGTYRTKKKITTTEEDGWINTRRTHGRRTEPRERYFKGNSVSYHYQTNDPKVTNPALFIMSIVMLIAALAMFVLAVLFHAMTILFFGVIFVIFGIVILVSNVRAIHRVEKEIQDREEQ